MNKQAVGLRQGDIFLVPVQGAPTNFVARPAGRLVLGHGETTGHLHILELGQWVVAPETTEQELHEFAVGTRRMTVFVAVTEETHFIHHTHAPHVVAPGVYEVVRQREYSPDSIRPVAD